MKTIRQNLLLGLLTLAPLAVTLWVLVTVVGYLDSALYLVFPWSVRIPGLGIVVCFLMLLITGFVARTYFGKFLNSAFDALMSRVPVLRGLYSGTKQISNVFFAQNGAAANFKRVVLVPFPSEGSRAIGFVAGQKGTDESYVFVPTAPNPTSGYVVAFRNSQLTDAGMGVDEAFRIIVSCGFLK